MSGSWVIVCGPSGAGKDSVLHWAAEALAQHPRICFARRLVTRAAGPGADDDEINLFALEALRARGGLAFRWQAHGLHYGVRSEYGERVAGGDLVVVNGSREHARTVAGSPGVRCVLVTAPPGLLAARLRQRGREDTAAVTRRMERNAQLEAPEPDCVIVNDRALPQSGAALRDYLLALLP